MSNNTQHNKSSILSKFASVASLIAAVLYFVGWIYRWQYYGFFQLEIASLNFSAQSFLFIPLQVFFGSKKAIIRTILSIVAITILFSFIFWLFEILAEQISRIENLLRMADRHIIGIVDRQQKLINTRQIKKQKSWLIKIWLFLTRLNIIRFHYVKFLLPAIEEIIIVAGILAVLYFLANTQGYADARRDSLNSSSTLPVITLIINEQKSVLGRKLDDPFSNPSLKGYRIFGDKGLFDDVRTTELNDFYNQEEPRVWRLLLKQDSWIYLIRTLPSNSDRKRRPPVLAIQKTLGDQLLILSPEPIKPDTSFDLPQNQ